MKAGSGKPTGKDLRLRLSGSFHLIAPCGIRQTRIVHPFVAQRDIVPRIKDAFEGRVIGYQRRRLQGAGSIGFAQRRDDRQRRIERRRSLSLKATSISATSPHRLAGAVADGFLLGFIEVFLQAYLPESLLSYRDAFTILLVIAVLLFAPQGLLARKAIVKL